MTAEFRLRSLEYGIEKIDAVLFTHAHADHTAGVDDIRRYNELQGKPIPFYGTKDTLAELKKRFGYIFSKTQEGGGKPKIKLNRVIPEKPFVAAGLKIIPIPVLHGTLPILGYRIKNFAYITDVSAIPKKTFEVLDNKGQYLYAALAGIPAGLAMASKFSMFVLPPLIIGMWILHNLIEPKLRMPRLVWYSAVFAAVSVFTLALVYKFDLGLYYDGLHITLTRLDAGRSSFAWGIYSLNGVWWYFPMALALKTPIAALMLAAARSIVSRICACCATFTE